MAERDDLHQPLAEGAIKKCVGLRVRNADVFTSEVDRLVVLDLQVVIVDAMNREGKLCRFW